MHDVPLLSNVASPVKAALSTGYILLSNFPTFRTMWIIRMSFAYLRHLLAAKTPNGIHSPYLFELFQYMYDRSRRYYIFHVIERERKKLLDNHQEIDFEDFGAGSRTGGRSVSRRISGIARTSLTGQSRCEDYFRLTAFLRAKTVIEIGTSLGISTAYFGAANRSGVVFGLEGVPGLVEVAKSVARTLNLTNIHYVHGPFDQTLPGVLQDIPYPDLVIIDGNHRKAPTIQYFTLIKHHRSPDTVVIVDDIRWSPEMHAAWLEISSDPDVTAAVDCFKYGMLFFRPEFKEKISLRLNPRGVRSILN